jgi:dolichol-phosphate mannosyltransferase
MSVIGIIKIGLGVIIITLILNVLLGLISLISIAVIGEYVGRILEETKHRPRFLVASFIQNGDLVKNLPKRD